MRAGANEIKGVSYCGRDEERMKSCRADGKGNAGAYQRFIPE